MLRAIMNKEGRNEETILLGGGNGVRKTSQKVVAKLGLKGGAVAYHSMTKTRKDM